MSKLQGVIRHKGDDQMKKIQQALAKQIGLTFARVGAIGVKWQCLLPRYRVDACSVEFSCEIMWRGFVCSGIMWNCILRSLIMWCAVEL